MQGYNDGLTSLPQEDEYAEPRLSPELAAKEEFEAFEREEVTKQIFEEGLGLAGVALLKQVRPLSWAPRLHSWKKYDHTSHPDTTHPGERHKQQRTWFRVAWCSRHPQLCMPDLLLSCLERSPWLMQGVQGLVDDIDRMEPFFTNLSIGQE